MAWVVVLTQPALDSERALGSPWRVWRLRGALGLPRRARRSESWAVLRCRGGLALH